MTQTINSPDGTPATAPAGAAPVTATTTTTFTLPGGAGAAGAAPAKPATKKVRPPRVVVPKPPMVVTLDTESKVALEKVSKGLAENTAQVAKNGGDIHKIRTNTSWLGCAIPAFLFLILMALIASLVVLIMYVAYFKSDAKTSKTETNTSTSQTATSQPVTPLAPPTPYLPSISQGPTIGTSSTTDTTALENKFDSAIQTVRNDVNGLRTDIGNLTTSTKNEFAAVRSDFDGKLAANTDTLRQEIKTSSTETLRVCVGKIDEHTELINKEVRADLKNVQSQLTQILAKDTVVKKDTTQYVNALLIPKTGNIQQLDHVQPGSDISQDATGLHIRYKGGIINWNQKVIWSYPYVDGSQVTGAVVHKVLVNGVVTSVPKGDGLFPGNVYKDGNVLVIADGKGGLHQSDIGAEFKYGPNIYPTPRP